MKAIKLYKIRNWVRGLTPLYISICAALLLDLKSNINCDVVSILYIGGLMSFGLASIISNILSNRCNDCGRIYDIKMDNYERDLTNKNPPVLKDIYEIRENKLKNRTRWFMNYGVFICGILGLFLVILSYSYSGKVISKGNAESQSVLNYIDSLETINIKQSTQILKLKEDNNNLIIESQNMHFKLDSIYNLNQIK